MAGHEIIIILLGLTLVVGIIIRRRSPQEKLFVGKLPEMVVAVYVLALGIPLVNANFNGSVIPFGKYAPLILLLLPAAMAASGDNKFNTTIIKLVWLIIGITLALFNFLQQSGLGIIFPEFLSPAILSILFLITAIFLFGGLNRSILCLATTIWVLGIFRNYDSLVIDISILLGILVFISTVFLIKSTFDRAFAFGLGDFIRAIDEPFLILDPIGRIVYVNDSFLKLGGYDKLLLLQTEAVELFNIPSDWRFKSSSNDIHRKIRCHLIPNNGEQLPVLLYLNEIYNHKRNLTNLVCMVQEEKERELLENRINSESARFSSLYETSLALSSSLEIKDVLNSISSAAEKLTRADSSVIFSLDRSRQIIRPIYSSDEDFNAEIMSFELAVGEGLTGRVVADGKPRLQNYDDGVKMSVLVPGTKEEDESLLVVPLMAKDLVIGALTLYKVGNRRFQEDDIKILTVFASQASAVIENSRLYMRLKASEKLYRFSVDLAGDAIFFVNPETGKISDCNELAQKLFKYSKAEFTAMHIWELQPEPQMSIAKRLWQEANKIGWGKLGEIDYLGRDGQKTPTSVMVSILYTGDSTSIQWMVRDISEHKRALEKAGFLQQIFEHLGEPIFLTDTKGRSLYANEAFCETFNISRDDISKGELNALCQRNPNLTILKSCWDKLGGNDYLVDQISIGPGNKEEIFKTISIMPFRAEQGSIKYYVWLFGPPYDPARNSKIETCFAD
jgi:PAS domain S-box-containing protein